MRKGYGRGSNPEPAPGLAASGKCDVQWGRLFSEGYLILSPPPFGGGGTPPHVPLTRPTHRHRHRHIFRCICPGMDTRFAPLPHSPYQQPAPMCASARCDGKSVSESSSIWRIKMICFVFYQAQRGALYPEVSLLRLIPPCVYAVFL